MNEYGFSLFGAIFGFLLVLIILVRLEKSSVSRYIDGVVLSFLFVIIIGYIGSLLGGQVYGKPTDFGIEISYMNPNTPVRYQVPIFPLPIVYAVFSFIIFSALYILSLFLHVRGFIGYIGLIVFSVMILIFDSFSGKQDILSVTTVFNLPQVFAFFLAAWGLYMLFQLFRNDRSESSETVHLG